MQAAIAPASDVAAAQLQQKMLFLSGSVRTASSLHSCFGVDTDARSPTSSGHPGRTEAPCGGRCSVPDRNTAPRHPFRPVFRRAESRLPPRKNCPCPVEIRFLYQQKGKSIVDSFGYGALLGTSGAFAARRRAMSRLNAVYGFLGSDAELFDDGMTGFCVYRVAVDK